MKGRYCQFIFILTSSCGEGSPPPPPTPPNLSHPAILTNQIAPFIGKRLFALDMVRLGVNTKNSDISNRTQKDEQHNDFHHYQVKRRHCCWCGYFTTGIQHIWNIAITYKMLYPGLIRRLFFLAEDWKLHSHSLHLRDVVPWKESSGFL